MTQVKTCRRGGGSRWLAVCCLALLAVPSSCAKSSSSEGDDGDKGSSSSGPHRIHLEVVHDDPSSVIAWWMTAESTPNSVVQYGYTPKYMQLAAYAGGPPTTYSEPRSDDYVSEYMHVVKLTGLPASRTIYYRVGHWKTGFSDVMQFKTRGGKQADEVKVVIVADQDSTKKTAEVVDRIVETEDEYAFAWLLGDISYAGGDDQEMWDKHAEVTQPMYTRYPSVAVVGNWEEEFGDDNYPVYGYRWRRAEKPEEQYWFSIVEGPVHFLSLSCEQDITPGSTQYEWLEAELKKANDPEQRHQVPWIVAGYHKPAYGSGPNEEKDLQDLDPLFRQYGLNLMISGHNHLYERTWPMYDGSATSKHMGPSSNPYVSYMPFGADAGSDPLDPIHITAGTSGHKLDKCKSSKEKDYSATGGCVNKYGFGTLTATRDKITWRFIGDDGDEVDEFVICAMPGCSAAPSLPK